MVRLQRDAIGLAVDAFQGIGRIDLYARLRRQAFQRTAAGCQSAIEFLSIGVYRVASAISICWNAPSSIRI